MEVKQKINGLGTLDGVYVPTLLTILGVILYLRLGWIVGNAGLLGAIGIILIAHLITITTAFSMSSMLTNIKVGSGGAYSIISQSLGFEMGGAIGIPLYLSQAVSVAFYITGFTELWRILFPEHPIGLIAVLTWMVLAGLSYFSTKLAFQIQYFILGAVVLSLISFAFGSNISDAPTKVFGEFQEAGFWRTFSIFFPAVTGILTGATMSGELRTPRKSIIQGTLGSVFTGLAVYLGVAVLFASRASAEQLLSDGLLIFALSRWQGLIIAGIMGAVVSSALSTLVSAPRTLAALAENRSVPYATKLARKDAKGAPLTAVFFSSLLSLSVILLGNLDGLASLLTLFFLTTYAMINLVVLLEQLSGIASFRPIFSVSILVPVAGFLGCVIAMFLISKIFMVGTVVIVSSIYYLLQRRKILSPFGDVRGGVFHAIAEWAAQRAMELPYHPKLWKPSLLIPVAKPEDFRRISGFVEDLIAPSGRAYYLTVGNTMHEDAKVDEVLLPLKEKRLFTQKVMIRSGSYEADFNTILQSLSHSFLAPNSIFFTLSDDASKRQRFRQILKGMEHTRIGLLCLHLHGKYHLGQSRNISLWLRDRSPNHNLSVLSALQLNKNWQARVTLCRVVANAEECASQEAALKAFVEDARLPLDTRILVQVGHFKEVLTTMSTDLHILGMPMEGGSIDYDGMLELMDSVPASVLFVADSGLENALV